ALALPQLVRCRDHKNLEVICVRGPVCVGDTVARDLLLDIGPGQQPSTRRLVLTAWAAHLARDRDLARAVQRPSEQHLPAVEASLGHDSRRLITEGDRCFEDELMVANEVGGRAEVHQELERVVWRLDYSHRGPRSGLGGEQWTC